MIDFKEDDLTLLPNQGHCNLNYLLEKKSKKYLVRKFRLQDRDRKKEFFIQKLVSKAGIAPKPHYLDDSIMITDFIKGKHYKKLSKKQTKELAITVKKLHKIPYFDKPIRYKSGRKFRFDEVLCHGDLSVGNVRFSRHVILIDWEYACVCDRYFDLASVCESFQMNERYFLKTYSHDINYKKLLCYKRIFKKLSKEWFEKLKRGKLEFL